MKPRIDHFQKEFPLFAPNSDCTVWEGYISSENPELKIRVSVPNYPQLNDFALECSPSMKACLVSQMKTLKTCQNFQGLIYSIAHLVKTKMSSYKNQDTFLDSKTIKYIHTVLSELESAVPKENIVKISDHFREIKVKYQDSDLCGHYLGFLLPIDYPRGNIAIVEADLPNEILSSFSKIGSIKSLYESFKENVESLIPFWKVCKYLEEKTWVVDPPNPQRKDVYRRIILNDHLSVSLTFNPLKITDCPDMKFFGSMRAVSDARAKYLRNLETIGWNEELDVAENISELLEVRNLPVKNATSALEERAENECYICYTYAIDDEEPPSKWCANARCASWYHYDCLIQWLESVVTSTRMYDHISGPCPYCDEKIWCPLKTNRN